MELRDKDREACRVGIPAGITDFEALDIFPCTAWQQKQPLRYEVVWFLQDLGEDGSGIYLTWSRG